MQPSVYWTALERDREGKKNTHSLLYKHASAGGEGSLNAGGRDVELCRGFRRVRWKDIVGKARNVRGDVSSHTSCLGSVSYRAVGYYVFMWGMRNKTDFSSQDRGLSDDGDHVYHFTVSVYTTQHTCMHTRLCRYAYIRLIYTSTHWQMCTHTNLDYIRHSVFLSLTHLKACKHTHHQLPKLKHLRSESTRWLQGSLENNPSTVSQQREVVLTEQVIIQSKHFSWRMYICLHRQLTKH